jgi:undecaprenyl phosphate-alpha-L-ara4N flippase subunit ArnE
MNFGIVTGFVGVIALTVAANLMLKLGAAVPASERVLFGVFGWKSLFGLVLFGCAGIVYGILLRSVPLNIAQAFTAAQFVAVVLAASVVLSEPISPARWTGILCISVGIALVGLTART